MSSSINRRITGLLQPRSGRRKACARNRKRLVSWRTSSTGGQTNANSAMLCLSAKKAGEASTRTACARSRAIAEKAPSRSDRAPTGCSWTRPSALRELGEPGGVALSPPVLDQKIAALDPPPGIPFRPAAPQQQLARRPHRPARSAGSGGGPSPLAPGRPPPPSPASTSCPCRGTHGRSMRQCLSGS